MTSLYNRATPSQRRILRAVEGAVKNAADAHPEMLLTPRFARSVAKRAAGTLTAQWPDVLAAQSERSVSAAETPAGSGGARTSQVLRGSKRGSQKLYSLRSPLRGLWKQFSIEVGEAKKAGQTERAETLIHVLKSIDGWLKC